MDYEKYQKEVIPRTCSDSSETERKVAGVLGLCEEVAELLRARRSSEPDREKILLEAGDVLWYFGYTAMAYGFSLKEIAGERERVESDCVPLLSDNAGKIAGILKKEIFHQSPADEKMRASMVSLFSCLYGVCSSHGISMEEVMDANNAKLLKRYPNGWSTEDARQRRDEA